MEHEPEGLPVDFPVAGRRAALPPTVRGTAVHRHVGAPTPEVEAADHPVVRVVAARIAPAGREAMTARIRVGDAVLHDADTAGPDLGRLHFAFVDGGGPAPSIDDLFAELAAPGRGGRSHPVHEGEPCLSSTSM